MGQTGSCVREDLNGGGRVTAADYLVVRTNLGCGPIAKP